MKIIVTGGAGFIGSNLVRLLLNETAHEVLNVDKLTYAGNLSSLAEVADHQRCRHAQVDICDPLAVRKIFTDYHPDAVIFVASGAWIFKTASKKPRAGTLSISGGGGGFWTAVANWSGGGLADTVERKR